MQHIKSVKQIANVHVIKSCGRNSKMRIGGNPPRNCLKCGKEYSCPFIDLLPPARIDWCYDCNKSSGNFG